MGSDEVERSVEGLEGLMMLVEPLSPHSEPNRFDNERELMSSAKQRKHPQLAMTPPFQGLDFPNGSRPPMRREH